MHYIPFHFILVVHKLASAWPFDLHQVALWLRCGCSSYLKLVHPAIASPCWFGCLGLYILCWHCCTRVMICVGFSVLSADVILSLFVCSFVTFFFM